MADTRHSFLVSWCPSATRGRLRLKRDVRLKKR